MGQGEAHRGPGAKQTPSHLFEVIQAMLVTVGDVQGVEVLQGAPLVWKVHGRDALQDLVQLLLAGGLWAQTDREGKEGARSETELTKHRAWGQPQKEGIFPWPRS